MRGFVRLARGKDYLHVHKCLSSCRRRREGMQPIQMAKYELSQIPQYGQIKRLSMTFVYTIQ